MPDLEQLLAEAATDPARRPGFLEALLAGQVFVLGFADRPLAPGEAIADAPLSIATWSDGDGRVLPFFTSAAALRRTIAKRPDIDPRSLQLATRDLFRLASGQRLVLDPDSDYGKVFMPAEVEALLSGQEPGRETEVVQDDTQVLVGAAADLPPELLRVLRDFFAARPAVVQAHLGWIVRPASDRSGYLLVVVAGDREAAMAGFGLLQIADVTHGHGLEAIVVPPGQPGYLLSSIAPFYVRATGGPGGAGASGTSAGGASAGGAAETT